MSKDNEIRDITRLQHILEEITDIEEILAKDFRDKLLEAALERKYTIIGEACRAISSNMKMEYKEVPWGDIIGMRNILVHEYYKVEKETLWDVAQHKIPALKSWIQGILEEYKN